MRLNHPLALALAIAALAVPSFYFDYEVQRLGGELSHMGALAVIGISVGASLVHVAEDVAPAVRRLAWLVVLAMAAYMFLVIGQSVLRAEFLTQAQNAGSDSEIVNAQAAIETRKKLRETWQQSCDNIAAPRRELRMSAAVACANIAESLAQDVADRAILAKATRERVRGGADVLGDAYIYFTALWRALVFPVGNVACLYFAAVLLRKHEASKAFPAPLPAPAENPQERAERSPQPEQAQAIPPELPAEQAPADGRFMAWLDGILGQRTATLPVAAPNPPPEAASERREEAPEWISRPEQAECGDVVLRAAGRIGISDGSGGLRFVHSEAPALEIPPESTAAEVRRLEREHADAAHVGELPKLPAPKRVGEKRTKGDFQAHCWAVVRSGGKPTFANLYDSQPGGKGDKTMCFGAWQEIKAALYSEHEAQKEATK